MADFKVRKFSQDEIICEEGSLGNVAYILTGGSVEISVDVKGQKKVLTVLKPVTIFGVMALVLKENNRTATATALEDVEVVEIDKEEFDEYIEKSPRVISATLKTLVERLQETTSRLKKHEELNMY
jgi:CRP-like cAMP-binding protein